MNVHTDVQIIKDSKGKPEFAVIPFDIFEKLCGKNPSEQTNIPHKVVEKMVKEDVSIARAWREYLGLTQAEVAERMGISQSALSQLEISEKLRPSSRRKIADALGIEYEKLA